MDPTPDTLTGLVPCRLCGSARHVARFPRTDLPVRRCQVCDALFWGQRPKVADPTQLYRQDYFLRDWPLSLGRFFHDFDPNRHHKTRFFQKQLRDLGRLVGKPGRVLDVGCANGVFVWLARRAGWDAEGVEVSAFAAEWGAKQFGVNIHVRELHQLPAGPVYDLITMWDTLEHVENPKQAIHAAFQRLKPGGYLAVLTPEHEGLVNYMVHAVARLAPRAGRRLLGQLYHDDHLTYFTRDSLCLNLIEHGFLIHWMEGYDEHPRDTNTRGLARAFLYLLYPIAGFLQLRHEVVVWAEKPGPEVPAITDFELSD